MPYRYDQLSPHQEQSFERFHEMPPWILSPAQIVDYYGLPSPKILYEDMPIHHGSTCVDLPVHLHY